MSLCYRCESRARFCETGSASRCECGDKNSSVYSCYMYKPVVPVVLDKNKGDKRPQFAGIISSRSHFVRLADVELNVKKYKDGNLIYWVPSLKRKKKEITPM